MAAHFSPIMIEGALVLPPGTGGVSDGALAPKTVLGAMRREDSFDSQRTFHTWDHTRSAFDGTLRSA
jgi:hypothetical protein